MRAMKHPPDREANEGIKIGIEKASHLKNIIMKNKVVSDGEQKENKTGP